MQEGAQVHFAPSDWTSSSQARGRKCHEPIFEAVFGQYCSMRLFEARNDSPRPANSCIQPAPTLGQIEISIPRRFKRKSGARGVNERAQFVGAEAVGKGSVRPFTHLAGGMQGKINHSRARYLINPYGS
jgi:hypothetical protein